MRLGLYSGLRRVSLYGAHEKIIVIYLMLLDSAVWANAPIEQGIRLFNQKEYQQAQQIFQQQSDAGSSYAAF